MKDSAHTPGPWEADLKEPFTLGGDSREVIAGADGMVQRGICTFMLDTDEHPNGKEFLEDAANARLIAAAPDLLAACEAAQCGCSPRERDSGHKTDCWFPKMKEAITKATQIQPAGEKK